MGHSRTKDTGRGTRRRRSPDEARRRLDLTVRDVTTSPLGHLTGLDEPLDAYRTGGDSELLTLDGAIDLSRLAHGLHDLTKASLAELFPPPKK